jgi:predicted nucleic acid-binding protein
MIVLDASVLIAHLNAADAYHERATELLERDDDLTASVISLAEVLVQPARAGLLSRAVSALGDLGVRSVGLNEDGVVRLAVLRAETNLKLPDCCVLLTAEQVQGAVATFDGRLASAAKDLGLLVRQ